MAPLMATKRGRGRPKRVIPGEEWLNAPLPAYLQHGLEAALLEQRALIDGLEDSRKALLKVYGGFGIPNDLAYQLNDAQDPEMPEKNRRRILLAVKNAKQRVARGNHRGGQKTWSKAEPRWAAALIKHKQIIADRRASGHSENTIAKRLAELEGISLSTAKRWLKKN